MKFNAKFRKGARRVYKRKPLVKKAIKSAYNKVFAKKVQKVIDRNAEDKCAYAQAAYTGFNSNMTAQTDLLPLLPGVTKGINDNLRIGDQIRSKYLTVKGMITANLNFTGIGNCRIAVRQIICQPKMYSDWSGVYNNYGTWTSTLLKKGGTTAGFTGVLSDIHSEINRDAITVYKDRIFYINTPFFQTAVGGVNTISSVKHFNYRIPCRAKVLKYDDGVNSGITPTNWCPVMLIGYAHVDGTVTPDTVNTQIQEEHVCNFHFQDM